MFDKKLVFKPYPKVDLVLLDENCSNLDFNFVKYKVIKSNEVNVYHLFFALIKFIFSIFNYRKLSEIYFIEIINQMNPKIGLGCEIDFRIYRFLKFFPNKKSIIYQFGFYNFDYINEMKNNILNFCKSKEVKCDYFFLWHSKYKKYFTYFKTKFIVNGSTRSNEVKIKNHKKKYDILFISSFRKPVKSYYGTNKHYLTMNLSDATSSYVLKILNDLQTKYNFKISVAMVSNRKDKVTKIDNLDENNFIRRDLKKYQSEAINSYRLAEKANLIVSTHSTLGQELLSRGHKVLFINPDHFFYNENILNNLKRIVFETSYKKEVISKSILKLLKMTDRKWKNLNIKKKFQIPFDQNNKNLKKLIEEILR